ncbi:MAG: hypothetical protein WCB51_03365 [Candidatus Dormiibacterota bacterium]
MVDWTLVGVWVTAAGALLTALLVWLSYQHARAVSGRRKPISIKASKGREVWVTYPLSTHDPGERPRVAWVSMFNQSAVAQSFVVDVADSVVLAPKMEGVQPFFRYQVIDFAPNEGGNVSLVVSHVYGEWPDDIDPLTGETREPYRLRLIGATKSGRRARWEGEVHLQDPFWEPAAE